MQILTEYIEKWHEENDRQPEDDAGAIHPSSLGDCNRRTIYKYKGVPRDLAFNAYKQAIFFHGYRIEDWMNEALEAKGLLIAKNVPVKAEYKGVPVEGTIDHIVSCNVVSSGGDFYSNSGWCIADTKSVSDHAFKHQSFPYSHHVLQLGTYQWALGQMLANKRSAEEWLAHLDLEAASAVGLARIQTGTPPQEYPPVLFYVGRGNLKELPPVSVGDSAMDLALAKLDELIPYIESGAYPPRPFKTPEEHPYLCSRCIRKGYQKKDKTYSVGKEPEYAPSCEYFETCWGTMPERWSFWFEVKPREPLPTAPYKLEELASG